MLMDFLAANAELKSIFSYFASNSGQHKYWLIWEETITILSNTPNKLLPSCFKTHLKTFFPSSHLALRIYGSTWKSDITTFLPREGKTKTTKGTDFDIEEKYGKEIKKKHIQLYFRIYLSLVMPVSNRTF